MITIIIIIIIFSFSYCFSHFEDTHVIKTLFHRNRNTQIRAYTIKRLVIDAGKTCEVCSIVHWGETSRRP